MPNPDGSATEKEQHDSQVDALERAVAGAQHRVAELEGLESASEDQIEAAKADVKLAKANLSAAVNLKPSKARSSRPSKAKESR